MEKRFNRVTAEGFNGVREPLKQAGWVEGGAVSGDVVSLCAAMIFGELDTLRAAMAPEQVRAQEIDAAWDLAQQRFTLGVQLKLTDPAAKIRAAAATIQDALLWRGGGTGQVILSYEAEADFGLKQIDDAKLPHVEQALRDAGLVTAFQEIISSTHDLVEVLGRSPDQKKREARSDRERGAVRACIRTFELAHAILARLIAHTPAGPDLDRARRLLIPLDALAERSA